MTQFVRGLRSIQYIIVSIIFVKKVIILKFCQKQAMFYQPSKLHLDS